MAGPPIMKYRIQAAMRKMKLGKAQAFEDYGIDKITTPFNEIYDTVQMPPDLQIYIYS